MVWQWTLYKTLLILMVAVSTLVALKIYFSKRNQTGKSAMVLLLIGAGSSLFKALELWSINFQTKLFWHKLEFLGIILLPTAWLIFAILFTGRDKWLKHRTLAALSVVPLATLLMVFTNHAHGLIWSRSLLTSEGSIVLLDHVFGPGMWVLVAYSYMLFFLGVALFIQKLIRWPHLFRWQSGAMLFAAFVVGLANIVGLSRLAPFRALGATPLAFTIVAVAAAMSYSRLKKLDIIPWAREAIFENMVDGVMVLEAQDRVVDMNPAAQRLIGCTPSDAIGQPLERVWPELFSQMELSHDGSGGSQEIVLGKGKEKSTYDVRISPLMDRRNSVHGQIVVIRDITERKQAEEAVLKSERYFRLLLYSMHEDILVIDRDSRITDVNNTLLVTLGLGRDEVIGRHCYEVLHGRNEPCDMEDEPCSIRKIFETGQSCNHRHVHRHSDGSKIWVDIICSPLKDEHGNVTHVIEAVRDITDLIRGQEALQESEERYRTAIESFNDGFAMVRGDEYLFVNKKFVEIFGYDRPEEILGKHISLIVHPDDAGQVVEINRRTQKGDLIPLHYEFKGVRKDGTSIDVEASAIPTSYRSEEVSLVYLRDITERKRTEREMAALEEQLRHSQKMEAIGLLAGGIAHDFNNLLMLIFGNVELGLTKLERSHPLYDIFSKIQESAKKASGLTQKLLAFGRRQVLQPRILDVAKLIGNLSEMFDRIIGEDIELKIESGPNLGHVYADPGSLEQILMNLAVNARDAMPQGGVLTISAQNIDLDEKFYKLHPYVKPGNYIGISFTDTGVGMDERTLQRIFDPFFTTKEQGTGLGLAMVYGIVKQHKGYVIASSQPGQGARFDLYFPLHKGEVIQESFKVLKKPAPRGTETLLMAEDENEVRELFGAFLEELGYKVFLASDGEGALDLFSVHHQAIDLVIMDAVMPKLSGPKTYDQMKSLSPDLPCLFLTGYSEEVVRKHFDRNSKIQVLRKPVTFEELGRKVREVLDQQVSTPDRDYPLT
jgi:PAS domain S-box-containing protein